MLGNLFGKSRNSKIKVSTTIPSYAADKLGSIVNKIRSTKDEGHVIGRMTVIKNPGRDTEQILALNKKNLLTNAGRDAMHDALYIDTVASQVGFNHIGLSTNATAPADTDTTLAGEIGTNGLARALATTRTHTVDTNTTTVEHTFTATGTHTDVQKAALFDLISGGVMAHENTFTAVTLQNNDTLQVTWTITLDD